MGHITIEISDETLLALKVSQEEAGEAVLMAAATKLFELGKLSSGAAARLAGVPLSVFLIRLADYGVDTFRLTKEDFRKETRLGRGRLRYLSSSVPASTSASPPPTLTGEE